MDDDKPVTEQAMETITAAVEATKDAAVSTVKKVRKAAKKLGSRYISVIRIDKSFNKRSK